METYTAKDLYQSLEKLSGEELFKVIENSNAYDELKLKEIAITLDVKHPRFNDEDQEREILFDIINRILQKDKKMYEPDELVNVRISEFYRSVFIRFYKGWVR